MEEALKADVKAENQTRIAQVLTEVRKRREGREEIYESKLFKVSNLRSHICANGK